MLASIAEAACDDDVFRVIGPSPREGYDVINLEITGQFHATPEAMASLTIEDTADVSRVMMPDRLEEGRPTCMVVGPVLLGMCPTILPSPLRPCHPAAIVCIQCLQSIWDRIGIINSLPPCRDFSLASMVCGEFRSLVASMTLGPNAGFHPRVGLELRWRFRHIADTADNQIIRSLVEVRGAAVDSLHEVDHRPLVRLGAGFGNLTYLA